MTHSAFCLKTSHQQKHLSVLHLHNRSYLSKCENAVVINRRITQNLVPVPKGSFIQAIFAAQFNAIFVTLKLQLQNGACKPAAMSS